MARSMNGINNIEVNNIEFPDGSTISSASNLVQLDTIMFLQVILPMKIIYLRVM